MSLALAGALAIGGTIAYITTSTKDVENSFMPSSVSCEVIEDNFTNGVSTVKTGVCVKNTGDVDAYIRAKVVVNWVDDEGNVLGVEPKAGTDYLIQAPGSGWSYCASDDCYYYASRVPAESFTNDLIDYCKVNSSAPADGYALSVEILASAIQADGVNSQGKAPVEAEWGVKLDPATKIISKA